MIKYLETLVSDLYLGVNQICGFSSCWPSQWLLTLAQGDVTLNQSWQGLTIRRCLTSLHRSNSKLFHLLLKVDTHKTYIKLSVGCLFYSTLHRPLTRDNQPRNIPPLVSCLSYLLKQERCHQGCNVSVTSLEAGTVTWTVTEGIKVQTYWFRLRNVQSRKPSTNAC